MSKVVFHGTSERQWRRRAIGNQSLYLATSLQDAANYAYEAAAQDENAGFAPRPLVLSIDIRDLKGLEFEPDWGAYGVTEATTWKQTMDSVGSFVVSGAVEKYKSKFHKLPKHLWATTG